MKFLASRTFTVSVAVFALVGVAACGSDDERAVNSGTQAEFCADYARLESEGTDTTYDREGFEALAGTLANVRYTEELQEPARRLVSVADQLAEDFDEVDTLSAAEEDRYFAQLENVAVASVKISSYASEHC